MHQEGAGLGVDAAKASGLFRKACDDDHMAACFGLAQSSDPKTRVRLLSRACDQGFAPGCLGLGMAYLQGQGVDKDPEKAKPLLRKACNAGHADACRKARRLQ